MTAELVSAAVRPESSPVVAVGGAAIDRTPAGVKDWAIRHFGTNDKLVLQLGILGVLTVLALALGVVAARRRRTGSAGVLLFGVVGAFPSTGSARLHERRRCPAVVGRSTGGRGASVLALRAPAAT
jgi:hypothetical protein